MDKRGNELVLTPNKLYNKAANRCIIVGSIFLLLTIFLAVRLGDFWQLPLAIGIALSILPLLYKLTIIQQEVVIPQGNAFISWRLGCLYQTMIWKKEEVEIVTHSVRGKSFYALANKQNPYGKAYQISPFLTNEEKALFFEKEILPIIQQQLSQ